MKEEKGKVLLIVRDGWGYAEPGPYNAIALANTPFTDALERDYPTTLLKASGEEVGLPEGYFGNSEVGHMTMGAGRVILQSLLRINRSIEDGTFFENPVFLDAIRLVKENGGKLHLLGLLQKEGVHAHFKHFLAFLELAKREGLKRDDVLVHVVTDGRDAEPQHARTYLAELLKAMDELGVGKIASLSGRYYTMDRNENWERTEKAYRMLRDGARPGGDCFTDALAYLAERYEDARFSDEFLDPIPHCDYRGFRDEDVFVNISFRKDRERQISHVLHDETFTAFPRDRVPARYVAMTEYYPGLRYVAFPDLEVDEVLGEVIANAGKNQLRISETEKYAHVTFFFDGGKTVTFPKEEKIIIPSPDVPTYDLKPEMSSEELTERILEEIPKGYDFILLNYPNADMVGHTGKMDAIIAAVEAVDRSLARIVPRALEEGYHILLTGDHGNAEYKNGGYATSHTANPVPFTYVAREPLTTKLRGGLGLKNVAATVLRILEITKPDVYEREVFED